MSIRIGLFGNGFARHVMLPGLRHVQGIDVVGIASPNLERARETARQFGIGFASSDHRDLLAECSPDLVFVVTPPHRHLDQTLDALSAGCHVVCEKPTAMDGVESHQMLTAAESHDEQLTIIDHELRMDPRRRQLVDWVREGRFGDILYTDYTAVSPSLLSGQRCWSWWNDAAQGGGVLGALGSHAVDSLRSLLGDVSELIHGSTETCFKTRPDAATGKPVAATADELAWASLRFDTGALARVHLSMVSPERRHVWSVTGTRGCAILEEQRPLRVSFGAGEPVPVEVPEDLPSNAELGIPDTDWARNFIRLAREVVSAIQEGRTRVPGAATFVDGHETQKVLDAVRNCNHGGTESSSRSLDVCD